MQGSRFRIVFALLFVLPVFGMIGCNGGDDSADVVVVTNTVPAEVGAGTLQVNVVGALLIDAFTQVNVKVDGADIGSLDWPDGGTLSYPTTAGNHTVTATTDGPSPRRWEASFVNVPEGGSASVTLNTGNSTFP